MPHERKRHSAQLVSRLAALWPAVGILGLRQVGKTTLLRNQLEVKNLISFDDEEILDEARLSAKNFLSKLQTPVILDEVQKVPAIFDAIKLQVDKKRIPGSYYLTGSSVFSGKLGIRESLTGRIGQVILHPFSLAEAHQKILDAKRAKFFHLEKPRFSLAEAQFHFSNGGMPVPAFLRDDSQRESYFQSWLETTIIRDVSRVFGKGYDPDVSWSLLRQWKVILNDGEFASIRRFKQDSRKVKKYLAAFADVFLIRKIPCHEQGVGYDVWVFSDSGIARFVAGTAFGEGTSLSLARTGILNEISSLFEYAGHPLRPVHYKSARGSPVDLVSDETALKVTMNVVSGLSYDERALAGAMKKLGLKRGLLVAPVERFETPKSQGIGVVPWSYWS